jgi:anti-sigma regulatory factor (Ser/Thr protein kinase)
MKVKKLTVKNNPDQLELIRDFIEMLVREWGLDSGLVFRLNLILEEYINNLISYGFSDQLPHEISLEIIKEGTKLTIHVKDDGNPFDILNFPENEDIEKPLEERKIGGLGIHFIKTLADEVAYKSEGGVNKLTFVLQAIISQGA